MRVFVTGGAGYIGSVITDQLIDEGHDVVVYDNLSKGHRASVSDRATFIHGELLDQPAVERALKTHAIDAVIHMAASSLVGESMTNPERYYVNNVIVSVQLLNAMLATDVNMLVLSSTAAVYGEPVRQPISEDDPTAPSNPYGQTKLAIERAMHWYNVAHQLKFVSLRYFNAAGATERRGEKHNPETHLIPLVLRAARDPRHAVTVFGDDYPTRDGTCVRDYIHVSDLARAHVSALAGMAGGKLRAEIFNLGCGEGYSVKEVIDVAKRVTGRNISLITGPRRPGDHAVLIAASDKIRRILGWTVQHSSLEEIVSSAWRWEERAIAAAPAVSTIRSSEV